MATFKCIEASAENIAQMQSTMNEMDCMVQATEEKISAVMKAMKMMLKESDLSKVRNELTTLCDVVWAESCSAMNYVNCEAERWGAHYIEEVAHG